MKTIKILEKDPKQHKKNNNDNTINYEPVIYKDNSESQD